MTRALSMSAALAVCLVGGCSLQTDYAGTHYRCDDDGRCPGSLQCVEGVCQDEPGTAIDASTDGGDQPDASTDLCGDGSLLLFEGFDGDGVDETTWSITTDNASVMVVEGRLALEPLDNGGSAAITTVEGFQVEGTRVTFEMLPVSDVSSSAASVALVEPDSDEELATFFRDTFDLVLHTTDGDVDQIDYDDVAHRFMAIEIDSGAIRFSTSRDGSSWSVLATDPSVVIPLEAELSIWVENYAGEIQPYRFDSITWCTLD